MSLSRMAFVAGRSSWITVISPQLVRATSTAAEERKMLRPEETSQPSFFKKIYYRFKGIPLKGELHPPYSIMQDVDKEFFAPEALPDMPKDFKEYPERDVKNFPYPARRMYVPKTRCLMFPDSWFTPFYNVTGVSGPYLFFGGLGLFLINKEIFAYDTAAGIFVNWIILYIIFSKTFGYRLDKWVHGKLKQEFDMFKALVQEDLKGAKEFREAAHAETMSLMTIKENFPVALKEAMQMQLEAVYRANIQRISMEMKRRIDYLQETETAKLLFERNYMLNWIMNSVRTEVAENRDSVKENFLNICIEDLKSLAAKAQ